MPQLRVIVSGLLSGAKSVSYIVILLILVNYLFSIMGTLFFGINDTARFGTVPSSMISLFQVSTLASWTAIACKTAPIHPQTILHWMSPNPPLASPTR